MPTIAPRVVPLSKRASAYELVRKLMGQAKHLTFRGSVYMQKKGAKYTYTKLSSPQMYIDKLLKAKNIAPTICEYEGTIKNMLKTTDNPLCDEVEFWYDYFEVRVPYFNQSSFRISSFFVHFMCHIQSSD